MLKKVFAVPACLAGLSLLAPVAHAQSSVQLSGLADMYVADPRFAANYATSKGGSAGAEFVRNALRIYVEAGL